MYAYSWPSFPQKNAFIDTTCGMLSDLGLSVRPGNPILWNTPRQRVDLYVLHWPDAIFWNNASNARLWFWAARIVTNLTLLKARGTRIVWFVHNLRPHDLAPERQRVWTTYANALARLADGWISLSPSTAESVRQYYPALACTPHTFIWHPPYSDHCPWDRVQAREELGIPPTSLVYGHVGQLRPYKNVVSLAEHFERIAPEGAHLLLTGEAQGVVDAHLATLSHKTEMLIYRRGKLSPEGFDKALKAIDVFVAPYTAFLHSGALIHALSRGCVVVAPRAPFTCDLVEEIGREWVVLYDDVVDAATLARCAEAARRAKGRSPDLSALEPAANAGRLQALLSQISLPINAPGQVQPSPNQLTGT